MLILKDYIDGNLMDNFNIATLRWSQERRATPFTTIVTGLAKIDYVSANCTKLYFC